MTTEGVKRTAVGWPFSASHRDHLTGQLHGHSYEVIAWFEVAGHRKDARSLQDHLKVVLKSKFDHQELPAELGWAEDIAATILKLMPLGCVEVEVNRPLERMSAKYTKVTQDGK